MPLNAWARPAPRSGNGHELENPPADDLSQMIDGLLVPPNVAAISYPRGVRIRRVRVPAQKNATAAGEKRRTLIVSRRALRGTPDDGASGSVK
jgi:hypothetical protein